MPMKRETGKDRWRRVPKDYFKKRDWLQAAKLQFSGLACVMALGWWGLGVDWTGNKSSNSTDLNSLRANHGPVAKVHVAWETKCDACHVPFEPINGRSLFAASSTATNRSSDQLCMACHAGPAHHSTMIESEVKGCAECHRDHQGRDFSLVRLNDAECTSCHRALEGHIAPGLKKSGTRMFANVAEFNVKDHPAFTPEAAVLADGKLKDRGKLKFNHAQHMMPGIVKKPGDTLYTVGQIPLASARSRYQAGGTLNDPVRLDCGSCHRLDSTEIPTLANASVASTPWPSRSSGGYYLPVTFENDCRACHTLTFDPRLKDVEAPHGIQPDKVVEFLDQTYAAQVLADDPKILDVFIPAARIPGKSPIEATVKTRRNEAVKKATTFLFPNDAGIVGGNANNCLECHSYGPERSKGIPTTVEPTNVPEIWFTHAAFDHTAHRGVSCRECHAGSYALKEDGKTPFPGASSVATDVLIPGIDNCVQCHAPSKSSASWFSTATGPTLGGASMDCTECHRYHNGDKPLQGYGASAQDADHERTIAEFLSGKAGRSLKPPVETSAKP